MFACLCYINTIIAYRKKLDPKVSPSIYLGYKVHTKGYLIFNLTNHSIEVSINVTFHENNFLYTMGALIILPYLYKIVLIITSLKLMNPLIKNMLILIWKNTRTITIKLILLEELLELDNHLHI